jgi:hypothetical protein
MPPKDVVERVRHALQASRGEEVEVEHPVGRGARPSSTTTPMCSPTAMHRRVYLEGET